MVARIPLRAEQTSIMSRAICAQTSSGHTSKTPGGTISATELHVITLAIDTLSTGKFMNTTPLSTYSFSYHYARARYDLLSSYW